MKLRESYRRFGRKIEGLEENSDSTGQPTESTNMDAWGLPQTESPTKKQAQAGPRSPAHMYHMRSLVFIQVPQHLDQVLPEPVAFLPVDLAPLDGLHCLASVGKDVPSLVCQKRRGR